MFGKRNIHQQITKTCHVSWTSKTNSSEKERKKLTRAGSIVIRSSALVLLATTFVGRVWSGKKTQLFSQFKREMRLSDSTIFTNSGRVKTLELRRKLKWEMFLSPEFCELKIKSIKIQRKVTRDLKIVIKQD